MDTGIPFFDHMLEIFARHGLFDVTVKAVGDLEVDYHHTVEDVDSPWDRRSRTRWGTSAASAGSEKPRCRWTRRWRGSWWT